MLSTRAGSSGSSTSVQPASATRTASKELVDRDGEEQQREVGDRPVEQPHRVVGSTEADPALQDVVESQANFVWLPIGEQSAVLGEYCERAGVVLRPFPGVGVRITIGTWNAPPDTDATFAAWLTSWSIARVMKSMNMISATGRSPVIAAPTATPTKPFSEIGVRMTRPSPKRSSGT